MEGVKLKTKLLLKKIENKIIMQNFCITCQEFIGTNPDLDVELRIKKSKRHMGHLVESYPIIKLSEIKKVLN